MNKNNKKFGIKSSILQKKELNKKEKPVLLSKSQEKINFHNKNKNQFRNRSKLKQHNTFLYMNDENSNDNRNYSKCKDQLKAKPRTDPLPKVKNQNKSFSSINVEKKNNSYNQKSKNKNKIKKNIINHNTPKEQKFKTDINNKNFFRTKEKNIKINLINLFSKSYIANFDIKDNINFENIKYISLDNISSLFNSWQNCSVIYKAFEEELLNKNNFEIDTKTLQIKTKNHEAAKELYNQKFWILYTEYLIDKNYILNEEQFLSVINDAFSYMDGKDNDNNGYPCKLLINYFLEKIKKYSPNFQPDGSFDDRDETYISKLAKPASNLINKRKMGRISFNQKNYKIINDEKKKEDINDKNL